jgi:hypothetical protein
VVHGLGNEKLTFLELPTTKSYRTRVENSRVGRVFV